jgi:trigger factor
MQVSVEAGEGLKRKLTVQVPGDKVATEVENRLKSLQGRVKVDGFRPGKVPLNVVKQRYGQQVLQEVAGEIMENSYRDAITQENLRPAGDPEISAQAILPGMPIEFTATFEVYPEVSLAPVAGMDVEVITSSVQDADVDKMLETLRGQRTSWKAVERAAQDSDRVTVDFVGTIDGVAFDGGSAKGIPVVLGSGSMIPGFEEQILGVSAGGHATVKVTFPADYQVADLQNKEAEFAVTVALVEAAETPAMDDEFAKTFGINEGGLEKLRQDIRANMERELNNRLRALVKNDVMEKLIDANPVDVPEAVVRQEAENLKQQTSVQQPGASLTADQFMGDARRRVQLGMLLAEVIKLSGIQMNADKVRERIDLISRDYEDPMEVVRYYQSNPQLLRGIETLVMEDMVVDWIESQAKISAIEKTFDEVMNPAPGV